MARLLPGVLGMDAELEAVRSSSLVWPCCQVAVSFAVKSPILKDIALSLKISSSGCSTVNVYMPSKAGAGVAVAAGVAVEASVGAAAGSKVAGGIGVAIGVEVASRVGTRGAGGLAAVVGVGKGRVVCSLVGSKKGGS